MQVVTRRLLLRKLPYRQKVIRRNQLNKTLSSRSCLLRTYVTFCVVFLMSSNSERQHIPNNLSVLLPLHIGLLYYRAYISAYAFNKF